MRLGLLLAAAAAAPSGAPAAAGPAGGPWHADLPAAMREAGRLDRPVLAHFSASWCGPCRRMEPVLHSPAVRETLGREAVGVRLDFDRDRAVARRYGVGSIPADVLLAPDGRVLGVMSGYKPAGDYARRVAAVAGQYRDLRARVARTRPVAAPDPRRGDGRVPAVSLLDPSWDDTPALPAPSARPDPAGIDEPVLPPADGGGSGGADGGGNDGAFGDSDPRGYDDFAPADPVPVPRRTDRPAYRDDLPDPFGVPDRPAGPDARGSVPGRPRVANRPARRLLGMRGYCPVTLHQTRQWRRGDREFAWDHQGVTYFMADAEAFTAFVKNAEDFAPRLLGCDPVLYKDDGRAVPGRTEHAAIWRGGLFLFASARTRAAFAAAPTAYAASRQVLLIDEIEGVGTF